MIKAKLSNGTLVLGLSRENLTRLEAGRPILFDGRPFGYDGHIGIVFGETELAIAHELNMAGHSESPS